MKIPKNILDSAVALFDINESQLEPLPGGHFSYVYGFQKDSRSFVLRITPPSPEINFAEMGAILEWMRYLAEHGASVPSPVLSRDRKLIETIRLEEGSYLAMVLEAADGILSEEMQLEQWSDQLYETLGSTIGKIHSIATQFNQSQPKKTRPDWDGIPNNFNPQGDPNPDLAIIKAERDKVVNHLKSLPREENSFGLIHGDLHLGNFFIDVNSNRITIFDFDDCVYGWFMMDIATLVFDYPVVYPPETANNDQTTNFTRHLLNGYLSEKLSSKFWIKQLPYFLKLLEIGIYMLVYKEHDPEDYESWIGKFMHGRKSRIENGVPYLDLDFEEMMRLP